MVMENYLVVMRNPHNSGDNLLEEVENRVKVGAGGCDAHGPPLQLAGQHGRCHRHAL